MKSGKSYKHAVYACDECGNTVVRVCGTEKKVGSCGCTKVEKSAAATRVHGLWRHWIYKRWSNIKQRCYNKNNTYFANYGGRGIGMCQQWRESFETFLSDMGIPDKRMTLERLDNDGDYTPENCVWASVKTQQNNRRACRYIVFNGCRLTLTQQAAKYGKTAACVTGRLQRGWTVAEALTIPSPVTKGWRRRSDEA